MFVVGLVELFQPVRNFVGVVVVVLQLQPVVVKLFQPVEPIQLVLVAVVIV